MIHKNKLYLLGAIAFSFLPMILLAQYPKYDGFSSDAIYTYAYFLGNVVGLCGAVLLWWQYLLGIRPIISKLFKDLVFVNYVHQQMGIYGFLFIMLHPLLLIIGYGKFWKELAFPLISFDTKFDKYVALGKIGFSILLFIWLTSAIARGKLGFRTWKLLHYLGYLILPLIFIHATNIGSMIKASSLLDVYWKFLILSFLVVLTLRILYQFGLFKAKYLLSSIEQITDDTIRFNLQPLDKFIVPKIGQFVYFQLGLLGEEHPFTVSHFNEETGVISITTKKLGKFTSKISNVKPGVFVYLDGPYGVFTQEIFTTQKEIILVAGGIGITPFLRIVEKVASTPTMKVKLFFGNKTAKDIPFDDWLKEKLGKNLIHILSNEADEMVKKLDCEKGFVTRDILEKYLGEDFSKYDFFVCGPPVMMKSVEKCLIDKGVKKQFIHSERFSL